MENQKRNQINQIRKALIMNKNNLNSPLKQMMKKTQKRKKSEKK